MHKMVKKKRKERKEKRKEKKKEKKKKSRIICAKINTNSKQIVFGLITILEIRYLVAKQLYIYIFSCNIFSSHFWEAAKPVAKIVENEFLLLLKFLNFIRWVI